MNWTNIEKQYHTFKRAFDNAWLAWVNNPTDELYNELSVCKSRYTLFCSDVLEQLMEQNQDVLIRLKNNA